MVGGMPASVEAWVSTHDYTQCQAELDDIQLAYYDDFPKYAKKVNHTAGNGLPLGAEVNEKFRKYIYLDSGLLLRILDLDLGGARQLTELIIAGTTEDLVNKGGLAEMMCWDGNWLSTTIPGLNTSYTIGRTQPKALALKLTTLLPAT